MVFIYFMSILLLPIVRTFSFPMITQILHYGPFSPMRANSKCKYLMHSMKAVDAAQYGIVQKEVFGRSVFFKRDDLFCFPKLPHITGNKVRKLHQFYYQSELPKTIISYGGVQSNAMRALAAVCNHRQSSFIYLTRPVPQQLALYPTGNYLEALNAGMKLVQLGVDDYRELVTSKTITTSAINAIHRSGFSFISTDMSNQKEVLYVSQGVANNLAESGIKSLCVELRTFISTVQGASSSPKPWKIIFASGTGISAYYAAKYLPSSTASAESNAPDIEIIAVPCATTSTTLLRDLQGLQTVLQDTHRLPTVLSTEDTAKRVFGRPSATHFQLWQRLQAMTGMPFDLLYAPRAWELLLAASNVNNTVLNDGDIFSLYPDHHILYYHCGGCEGNESQLQRYRHLGDDVKP